MKSCFDLTFGIAPILRRAEHCNPFSSRDDYDRLVSVLHARQKIAHPCSKLARGRSQARDSFNHCLAHQESPFVQYVHYVRIAHNSQTLLAHVRELVTYFVS